MVQHNSCYEAATRLGAWHEVPQSGVLTCMDMLRMESAYMLQAAEQTIVRLSMPSYGTGRTVVV